MCSLNRDYYAECDCNQMKVGERIKVGMKANERRTKKGVVL